MKPVTTATTTSSMVATRSATAAVMDNLAVMRVAMTEMMSLEMAARSVGGRHAAMVNSTRVSNAMTVIKAMTTLARTHASPCVNTLIFQNGAYARPNLAPPPHRRTVEMWVQI